MPLGVKTGALHLYRFHIWVPPPGLKVDFLENSICFWHKIDKVEEVSLSLSNIEKNATFWVCQIFGNIVKIDIFVNNSLIKLRI